MLLALALAAEPDACWPWRIRPSIGTARRIGISRCKEVGLNEVDRRREPHHRLDPERAWTSPTALRAWPAPAGTCPCWCRSTTTDGGVGDRGALGRHLRGHHLRNAPCIRSGFTRLDLPVLRPDPRQRGPGAFGPCGSRGCCAQEWDAGFLYYGVTDLRQGRQR